MNTVCRVLTRAVAVFEVFCLNFTKGMSCNIGLVKQLVDDVETEKQDSAEATKTQTQAQAQTQAPAARTELARRRAETRRRQGVEESPKKSEKKTVRSSLWSMIKINCFLSVLMLMGMTQLFIPVLNWTVGDMLKKNQVLEMMISRLLVTLWLTPVMLLSKVTNTFLMNDLSSMAYKETMGNPVQAGVATIITDLLYTIIFQLFYFIEVSASAWVPLRIRHINVLELALSAIMYSMYAFEYKWMNMGYGARKRIDLIDRNFGFHFGFGFPLAFAVLYFENFWIGVALNSVLFPALILCANYAAEPKEIRGRTTYIFQPAQLLLEGFFWVVNRFGFRLTFLSVVALVVGGVLLWLGVVAAVFSGLTFVWDRVPHDKWMELLQQLWQEYV